MFYYFLEGKCGTHRLNHPIVSARFARVCDCIHLWTTHVWDPRNQTAPSVGLTVTAPTYSTVLNTGCKCANALYAMDLVLQHSAAGAVVAAFADVVLTDVTAAFASGSSTLLR